MYIVSKDSTRVRPVDADFVQITESGHAVFSQLVVDSDERVTVVVLAPGMYTEIEKEWDD